MASVSSRTVASMSSRSSVSAGVMNRTVIVTVDAVVPAMVDSVSVRMRTIIIAPAVIAVDWIVPATSAPSERTVEVIQSHIQLILIIRENISQVGVPPAPPCAVYVCTAADTEQIIQVNLVSQLILLVGKVKLVCHLVGQEQGFALCLVDWHCACIQSRSQ